MSQVRLAHSVSLIGKPLRHAHLVIRSQLPGSEGGRSCQGNSWAIIVIHNTERLSLLTSQTDRWCAITSHPHHTFSFLSLFVHTICWRHFLHTWIRLCKQWPNLRVELHNHLKSAFCPEANNIPKDHTNRRICRRFHLCCGITPPCHAEWPNYIPDNRVEITMKETFSKNQLIPQKWQRYWF